MFKPKPGEEAVGEATPWILHCGDHFNPRPTVLLLEVQEEVRGGGELLPAPDDGFLPPLIVEEGRSEGEVAVPTTAPPTVPTMAPSMAPTMAPSTAPTMAPPSAPPSPARASAPRCQYSRLLAMQETSTRWRKLHHEHNPHLSTQLFRLVGDCNY